MEPNFVVTMSHEPPSAPYYAVIFTSVRTEADPEGYAAMAQRMVELASRRPGFLGIESARGEGGLGITVSYWKSLEAIKAWREDAEHRVAQSRGRAEWYREFRLRVCRVEAESEFRAASQCDVVSPFPPGRGSGGDREGARLGTLAEESTGLE